MSRVEPRVVIREMQVEDIAFLKRVWANAEVMRYADEFPYFRGWSKNDDAKHAWTIYQQQQALQGKSYFQLIIYLVSGTPIGESFFCLHPDTKRNIGRWRKPQDTRVLVGDIKLLPDFWGKGLGTEAMTHILRYIFTNTDIDLVVVPPHRNNSAAKRVYEKAGFTPLLGKNGKPATWANHLLMALARGPPKT